jgi:hypothetical protein
MMAISEFSAQGLNNTAWAFASLQLLNVPMMSAIAEATLVQIS